MPATLLGLQWLRPQPRRCDRGDASGDADQAELDGIQCPVTLIWPDHDRLVERPPSLPAHVRSVVLDDAGHLPTWDAPDALAQLIVAADHDLDAPIGTAPDEA